MLRRRTDLVRVTGFPLARDGKVRADALIPALSHRKRERRPADKGEGDAASGKSNQNAYVSRLYITVVASSSPAVDSA
ncbi:hypothetical protein E05_09250 [Plautia stali symbiont]|nr:hypothetical protein E05_09250 [Plautia stali symbiont]